MWFAIGFILGCLTGAASICFLAYIKAQNESMEDEWQHLKDRLSEGKEEGK